MRHVARILFLTLALALLGLALTPKASPAQQGTPCERFGTQPYAWRLRPLAPCAGDSVSIVFGWCRDCVVSSSVSPPGESPLTLYFRMMPVCPATLVCTPDSVIVPLGVLATGSYALRVRVQTGIVYNDSDYCVTTRDDTLRFAITCPPPPPPVDSLPFVRNIEIGSPPPCLACSLVVCPNQPIRLHIDGEFPSSCYRLRKVEFLPSMYERPFAAPSPVRLTVEHRVCGVCATDIPPFAVDTTMAPLPPGVYSLPVQLVVVDRCDTLVVGTSEYHTSRPFTVRDSCGPVPPPAPCLVAGWDHSGRVGGCDTWLGSDHLATVRMTVSSPVALAGLQGTLSLYPPGLVIRSLEPIGPAAGMHLAWEPKNDGVHFVMFAEQGAPIGGLRDCTSPARCAQPVLAVTVGPGPLDIVPPPVTHVYVHDLLGSDSLGAAVSPCQIVILAMAPADVCAGASCDFNLDGTLDVRDLVTMVHCVLGTGPCPDTTLARLDCNGDGRLNVDDVLCCARNILHDGVRDTLPGRPEPTVAVELGEPAWNAGALSVPVRLRGAERVGAARLALTLPLERYDVAGVDLGDASGQWLALHDVVDGKLVVGLVGLSPATPAEVARSVELTLRLAPRAGQPSGGDLGLGAIEASGPDGVTLVLSTAPAPVPLPSPGALSLSPARPNPFGRETRFALNLERGADVEVTVHDLSGRRVATLFRGALAAGPHDFTWRGVRDDGSAASNGIYFLRARVGGERLTRKVIFLPGD